METSDIYYKKEQYIASGLHAKNEKPYIICEYPLHLYIVFRLADGHVASYQPIATEEEALNFVANSYEKAFIVK